ncbi:TetR family transcriptional regulator [Actinocatenispora thailandica]|uniref:TetR family transcriptional regulator n=1 Tax=Actinocatenispora thailandica TaxID=227318 RepID=A0A7R7DMW4_9ACTN|nr:TetR family transcriptional regulator [Actinocatenispora thailandica]BCJ34441.1 TetR family transcriptional regulator [Actinocatenispora thailandica]
MTAEPVGLRARKKQQTRAAISDQATRLFLARGFDRVTIAEIAEAAQVAKMTVTNYFPRKEDLALDTHDEFVTLPAATVRDRQVGESALAALRRGYLAAVAARNPLIGFAGAEFARLITGSPALVARLREFHEDREATLAETLADETGAEPDDVVPRVAAAQLAGVHRVLFTEALRRTLDGAANDRIAADLTRLAETAFALLEPSLAGYAVRAVA